MSDLYCPRCGEPWDLDCLHDEAQHRYGIPYYLGAEPGMYVRPGTLPKNPAYSSDDYGKTFDAVRRDFQTKGCGLALAGAYTSGAECEAQRTGRTAAAAAVLDLLGDDLDGACALMEDAEALGLF